MIDMLCATFLDNLKLSGVVVVIGVGMVFVILALLILLVNMLKYINSGLNSWDDMMYYVRAQKSEIKAIKSNIAEDKSNAMTSLKASKSTLSSSEYEAKLAELNATYASRAADGDVAIASIKSKYAEIKLIRLALMAKVKQIKADELTNYKSAVQSTTTPEDKGNIKKARIATINAMNIDIKALKAEAKAAIDVVIKGGNLAKCDDAPLVTIEGVTNEIIAAITAAIAIVTATEAEARKITFKVRSIKEVR